MHVQIGASSGEAEADDRPPEGRGGSKPEPKPAPETSSGLPERRRALHLFSGKKKRADGLAARLEARGWEVDEVDSGIDRLGAVVDAADDLLDDLVFFDLLSKATAGFYKAAVEGVPCSTFSVARFRGDGPPAVRRLPGEGRGLRKPPPQHEHEAERANELAWRACAIAAAVQQAGGVYIIENPIDRSDAEQSRRLKLGLWPEHASLWQLDEVIELMAVTGGLLVHFPQCALGGLAQKWTTLLYSPALTGLARLGELRCVHSRGEHQKSGGGRDADGAWATAKLAAYPTDMNDTIASAIDEAVPARGAAPASASTPTVLPGAPSGELALRVREACMYVPADSTDSTEGRPCVIAAVHTDDVELYYTVEFGDGELRQTVAERLRGAPVVGSKRPHAQLDDALESRPASHAAASMSLRNNEPELLEVLEAEALPRANVPPVTEWFDVSPDADVPAPLLTDELIPRAAQVAVAAHIASVRQCYARAERGEHGWKTARDMRPPPLELTEEESMHPAGRGWSWVRKEDGLWHPLTKSRWPDDPPESDLDIAAVLDAAKADTTRFGDADADFADQFVLACMAHGYPAPELARATVLGYPHVGALKSMEGLRACLAKDRKNDGVEGAQPWTVHGGAEPHVWPMRADPVNVVWRGGKPRITIDKTMPLSAVFESYNAAVALESYDPVEMVRVQQLCRAVAILLTARVGVRVWSFDLEAYFRKTGKQRADWWKSGYVLPDGFGFDKRVQFGQREAPVLTSRQSNFIVWAMRRELYAFDCAYPPRDARLLAWRLLRTMLAAAESAEGRAVFENPISALHFIMMYVDDVGAVTVDDLLYDIGGAPYYMHEDAELGRLVPCSGGDAGAVHARRPDAHYHLAVSTIEAFGHSSAKGKGVRPALNMDLLGVHIDVEGYRRMLTDDKCRVYGAAVRQALAAPMIAGGGRMAPYAEFNSMVHKLLHAASTVVLGRQHLHHCMAARRTENRLHGKFVLLHAPQVTELQWWLEQFECPTRHCLPMASRVDFPDADSSGVVVSYSDAAREIASPHLSGYGAWTVLRGIFYYVAGLWEPSELASYSINVLELAAENMGTFPFLARARELGIEVTHSLDFVDNTAAEYSADRGSAHAAGMQELVRRRFDALDAMGIYSAVERITSVDNEWADALSRGEERVQDVLRMARALGWTPHRLYPQRAWRDLSGLPRLDA